MATPRIKITNYWSGSDNPFPNYSYYYAQKPYIPYAPYEQAETYNPIKDYNDPFSLTSIADILTNKAALRSMSSSDIRHEIPWFDEHVYKPFLDWVQRSEQPGKLDWSDILQPLIAVPHLTRTAVVDPIIEGFTNDYYKGLDKFSGFTHAGLNIMMNFSETVDLFSNPIKGIFLEEDGPWEGFKRGSGMAGYRKNYDLDIEGYPAFSFFASIPFELVMDPLNWVTWGTTAIAKRSAKRAIQQASDQVAFELGNASSEVLERTANMMVKYPKLTTEQAVERVLVSMQNPLLESQLDASVKETFRLAANRVELIRQVANAIDETQVRTIVATSKQIRDAVDLVNKVLTRSVSYTTGFRPISYGFEQGREALEKMFKNRAMRALQNAVDTLPDLNSGSMFEDTMTVAEHIRKQANLTPEQALHYTQELYSATSMDKIKAIIETANDLLYKQKGTDKIKIDGILELVTREVAEAFNGMSPKALLNELEQLADFGKTYAVIRDQFDRIYSELTARRGKPVMRTALDITRTRGTLRELPARLKEYPRYLSWQQDTNLTPQTKQFLEHIVQEDTAKYALLQYDYSKVQADYIQLATEQVGDLKRVWLDIQQSAFYEQIDPHTGQRVFQPLYTDLRHTLDPVFETMDISNVDALHKAATLLKQYSDNTPRGSLETSSMISFLDQASIKFDAVASALDNVKKAIHTDYELPLTDLARRLGLPNTTEYIQRIPLYNTQIKIDLDPNVAIYHGKRFAVDILAEEMSIADKYKLQEMYHDIIFSGRKPGELVAMGRLPSEAKENTLGRVLSRMHYGTEAEQALVQQIVGEAQAQTNVLNFVQRIASTIEYEDYQHQILRTVYEWRDTNTALFPNTIYDLVQEATRKIEGNYGGILSGGNTLDQLFDATYKHAYLDTVANSKNLDAILDTWDRLTNSAIPRDNSSGLYNLARRVALDEAVYNGNTLKALRGINSTPFYYAITTDGLNVGKGNLISIAYWFEGAPPKELFIRPTEVLAPSLEELRYFYKDTVSSYSDLLDKHMAALSNPDHYSVEDAVTQMLTEARSLNARLGEDAFEMVGFNNVRFDDAIIKNNIYQGVEHRLTHAYDSIRKVDIWDQLTRTIEEVPVMPPSALRKIQSELTQYLYDQKATHPFWLVPEMNLFPKVDVDRLKQLREIVADNQNYIKDSSKLIARLDAAVWEFNSANLISDNAFNNSFFKYNKYTGEITNLVGGGYHNLAPVKNIMDVIRAPDGTQALEIHKLVSAPELKRLFPWVVESASTQPMDAMVLADLTAFATKVDVNLRRLTRETYSAYAVGDNYIDIQHAWDRFQQRLFVEKLAGVIEDPMQQTAWMHQVRWNWEIGQAVGQIPPDQAMVIMYTAHQELSPAWRKAYHYKQDLSKLERAILTGDIFDPRVKSLPYDKFFWDYQDTGGMLKALTNDSNIRFYRDNGETIDRIYNYGKAIEDSDAIWATNRAAEIRQLEVIKLAWAAEYMVDPGHVPLKDKTFADWFYEDVTHRGSGLTQGYVTNGGVERLVEKAELLGEIGRRDRAQEIWKYLEDVRDNLLIKDELFAVADAARTAKFTPEQLQQYLFTAGGRYTIRAAKGVDPGYQIELQKIIDTLFSRKTELLAHNIDMTVNSETGRLYMWLIKNDETKAQWLQFIEDFRNDAIDLKHIFSVPDEVLEHVPFKVEGHQYIYEKLQEEMSRFSGGRSLGTHFETMDYDTLGKMELYFPVWMQDKAFSVDDLREMKWIDGLRFNRTAGGNVAARREMIPKVSGNPFKNALNTAQSMANRSDAQTKMTALMFDGEGSIRGPMLADLSDEELLQAIHRAEPNYHLATVYVTEDGLTNVRAIHKPTLEQLTALRANENIYASILSKQQYMKVFDVLNKTEPLTTTEVGFFSKHIVDAGKKAATLWKVGYLTSPGFLIRNAISSTFKNLMHADSITDIPQNFRHLFHAIKLTKDYDTTFKFILDQLDGDKFSLRVLDALYDDPANASKLLLNKEQFQFIYNFMEQGPSAGLTGLQKKVVDQMIADNRAINGEHKSLFEHVANNPVSNTLLTWNSSIEQVMRLQSLLISVDNGYIFSEAIEQLIKTHFDQSTRTKAEYIADYVFPFFHFKKENLFYWLEKLHTKPYMAPLLGHIFNPIWNFSEYDNDEIFRNRSLQYHILQGNIIFDNNFVVKLSPSVMDTFNMISDPSSFISNLAVYFRLPVEQLINGINDMSEEDWKHMFWTNVPLIGPTLYKYWDLPQLVDRLLTDFGLAKIQEFGTPIGTATKAVERITGNDIFSAVSRLLGAIMPSMFGAVNRWDDRDFNYFRRYYPRKFYTKKYYVKQRYPRRSGGRGYGSRRRYYPRSRRPKRVYHRKAYMQRSNINYLTKRKTYARRTYPQKLSKAYFHGTYAMNTWASKSYAAPIPAQIWKIQMAARTHNIRMFGGAYKHADYLPHKSMREILRQPASESKLRVWQMMRYRDRRKNPLKPKDEWTLAAVRNYGSRRG